ncbi:MAG: PAS domain S-box protein [Bacteroidetes bacterium]|nr:PAS domain S-box protein [Bacteroidota bacterium]
MNTFRRLSNAITTHPNLAIIAITIFVIAGIVAGTFLAASDLESRLTGIVFSSNSLTSYTTASSIKSYLEDRATGLSSMAEILGNDPSFSQRKTDIDSYFTLVKGREVMAAILVSRSGKVIYSTSRKYAGIDLSSSGFWDYVNRTSAAVVSAARVKKGARGSVIPPYVGKTDTSSFMLIGSPIYSTSGQKTPVFEGAFAIYIDQFAVVPPPTRNVLGLEDTTSRMAIGLFTRSGYPFIHLWSTVPAWNRERIHPIQQGGRPSCASCHTQSDIDMILGGASTLGTGLMKSGLAGFNGGQFLWNSARLTSHNVYLEDSVWYVVVSADKGPVQASVESFSRGVLILMGGTVVFLVVILTFGFYAYRKSSLERQRLDHLEQVSRLREQYEVLIEKSNDGIYILFENRIVFANKVLLDMLGYTQEELSQKDFLELVAPESRHLIEERLAKFNRGEKLDSRYGFLALCKDGKEIPVEVSVSHIPFEGKIRTIGIIRDLSELTAQKQLYEDLFTNAPIGLGIYRNFRAVKVNETASRLLGYDSPGELIGIHVFQLVHPEDLGMVRERVKKAMEEKIPAPPMEEKFMRKDGSSLPVLVLSQPVVFEGEDAVQIAFVSLEDRKKLELNLAHEAAVQEKERARLDTLLQNLDEGILLQSPDGRIEFANSEFCRIFGFADPSAVTGRLSSELLLQGSRRAKDPDKFVASVSRAVEQKETVSGSRVEFTDGTVVERSALPIFNSSGNYTGRLGIFRDITQRERNEEAIKRLQRTELLGRLAGGIAHDFNNVLAIIIGSLQMILRKADNPATVEENTQRALSSAIRGSEVAKRLLQFVRYSPEGFTAFSLKHIVEETVSIIRHTFEENIAVRTEFILNDAIILGSPGDIQQVIINLANNSRDAMPDGGTLTISLTSAGKSQVEKRLASSPKEDFALLTIQDTGHGIEESKLERIFDPFFTTKELGKGTGLGLSIVQTIISAHGGFIDVRSSVSGGTTFFIYLPMKNGKPGEPAVAQSSGETSESTERKRQVTVLVVEDEPDLRNLLQEYLAERGVNVILAQNGEEGYELFKSHKEITAVLSDLGLPKLSGDKLIAMVRAERPGVKCVLATGYLTPSADGALAELDVEMIMKPYNLSAVYSLVTGDPK